MIVANVRVASRTKNTLIKNDWDRKSRDVGVCGFWDDNKEDDGLASHLVRESWSEHLTAPMSINRSLRRADAKTNDNSERSTNNLPRNVLAKILK